VRLGQGRVSLLLLILIYSYEEDESIFVSWRNEGRCILCSGNSDRLIDINVWGDMDFGEINS
jgi:hypothetical protein